MFPRAQRLPWVDHHRVRPRRALTVTVSLSPLASGEPRAGAMQRGAVTRMLEDERWLALVLLLPRPKRGRRRRRAEASLHDAKRPGTRPTPSRC